LSPRCSNRSGPVNAALAKATRPQLRSTAPLGYAVAVWPAAAIGNAEPPSVRAVVFAPISRGRYDAGARWRIGNVGSSAAARAACLCELSGACARGAVGDWAAGDAQGGRS